LFDYTPQEVARLKETDVIGRTLGADRGLKVKVFPEVNVPGIKNPKVTTKLTEDFFVEGGGKAFGSFISAPKGQLPEPFTTKKPGDVDAMFDNLKVEAIAPRLTRYTKLLRTKAGENVEVSPANDNVIQFSKGVTGTEPGAKFLEAKSGINQETLGLDDIAPEVFRGFNMNTGRTVKFGRARAITAGEQLLRKAAGASIISPGKLPGETPSFSGAGILGKQGNPRGLKDVAGFVQQTLGLINIRKGSYNPYSRYKAAKAEGSLNRYLQTFTPEQRADINTKLLEKTGFEYNFVGKGNQKQKSSSYSAGVLKSVYGRNKIEKSMSLQVSRYSSSPRFSSAGYAVSSLRSVFGSSSSRSPSKSPSRSSSSYSLFGSPSKSSSSKSSSSKSPSISPSSLFGSPSPSRSPSKSPSKSPSRSPSKSPSPYRPKSPSKYPSLYPSSRGFKQPKQPKQSYSYFKREYSLLDFVTSLKKQRRKKRK